ncbi:LytR/AlgR family response regulator transcription factor [Pseudoduganella buxea]|uniref:Response regulator n=1 Tax=Pseudoduganella buxea TaxID=1949069 RepID=A0A6I3SY41_9BURK|nr:response regulator [Pseudoduganella buxea]MTV54261.1 response regulator [Pseudoduganella buxea]GGB87921.1 DNA-binding response regulator [Pseudoduganella buxea]
MRILIVDDERPARDKLRRLLEQQPDVTALAEARDGFEALALAGTFAPDAIFLDIQMPEANGLEVAASLPAPAPLIVFVTAHDAYALRAFDASAIDYLLKPFDAARFGRSLDRLRERLRARPGQGSVTPTGLPPQQLLVTERGVTRVVPVSAIGWIETADNYVVLHTAQAAPLLRQSLAGLLAALGPAFHRCHRRAAVQLACIDRIAVTDKGDGEVLLRGGGRAPLSRQYRAALMDALRQLDAS